MAFLMDADRAHGFAAVNTHSHFHEGTRPNVRLALSLNSTRIPKLLASARVRARKPGRRTRRSKKCIADARCDQSFSGVVRRRRKKLPGKLCARRSSREKEREGPVAANTCCSLGRRYTTLGTLANHYQQQRHCFPLPKSRLPLTSRLNISEEPANSTAPIIGSAAFSGVRTSGGGAAGI